MARKVFILGAGIIGSEARRQYPKEGSKYSRSSAARSLNVLMVPSLRSRSAEMRTKSFCMSKDSARPNRPTSRLLLCPAAARTRP